MFSSCATPATNWPTAESFSLWISCACVDFTVCIARSSSARELCRLVVIWLNVTASSPHSSFEKRAMRREKSPRPTASALSRSSRSGRVTRRMKNQTTSALAAMPATLSPSTLRRVDCQLVQPLLIGREQDEVEPGRRDRVPILPGQGEEVFAVDAAPP